jgi:LysR family cys regulon transcriptional activator
MNFQQLRIIRETVRQNFNLTEVAAKLFTSQSGVSKHIKDLEGELGLDLFVRRGKRLIGLTDPGKELVQIVERILLDTQNIKQLGEQFSNRDRGQLTVATTHTQARYALPPVVSEFKKAFPDVQLVLLQGSPAEIVSLLLKAEADIGIATEAVQEEPELVTFPYHSWHHTVIVPVDHPLGRKKTLTLADVAEFPLITYNQGFTGRGKVDLAFSKAGLVPNIVMSALDADVIKAYVELGLGIGIVASIAFDIERDSRLRQLPSSHLFEPNTSRVAIRRGSYLRSFTCRFIELCVPSLTEAEIRASVSAEAQPT